MKIRKINYNFNMLNKSTEITNFIKNNYQYFVFSYQDIIIIQKIDLKTNKSKLEFFEII